MRCKACNAEMNNASDIYWREVEDNIKVMEDLCMTCRRKSYSTYEDEHLLGTDEEILAMFGIYHKPSRGSDE